MTWNEWLLSLPIDRIADPAECARYWREALIGKAIVITLRDGTKRRETFEEVSARITAEQFRAGDNRNNYGLLGRKR